MDVCPQCGSNDIDDEYTGHMSDPDMAVAEMMLMQCRQCHHVMRDEHAYAWWAAYDRGIREAGCAI